MNDAAESFLVFHDAELTGTYQKEYEGEIDAALEKDGEQYVLIVRQGETVCTLFFSRLSLEVHLFDYGKRVISGWTDTSICGRLNSVLRSCGTSWNTRRGVLHRGRNASGIAGQFPAAQFLLLPGRAGSVSRTVMPVVGSDGRGNYGDEKLASEAGDKVLLRYLALYEKWQGKLLAKQIAKLLHTSRHAKVVDLLEKKLAREAQNYPKRRFTGEEGTQIRKNPGAGNETEKDTGSRRKTRIIAARGAILYARDSVEYKVHLMIWGTRGKERVVEVETFKISRTQRQ